MQKKEIQENSFIFLNLPKKYFWLGKRLLCLSCQDLIVFEKLTRVCFYQIELETMLLPIKRSLSDSLFAGIKRASSELIHDVDILCKSFFDLQF